MPKRKVKTKAASTFTACPWPDEKCICGPQPILEHESVLQEAERVVNGPRRVEYGGVLQSFERIAAKWSVTLGVPVTAEQVSLCMIDLKTVRALQGFHRDSYVDICGYARCTELMQEEIVDRKEDPAR